MQLTRSGTKKTLRAADTKEVRRLRKAIRASLKAQGFKVAKDGVSFRQRKDKRSIRKRHEHAVAKRIGLAASALSRLEDRLLSYIASGHEVVPALIQPRLVQVQPDTELSQLFRYACLHWSIPVSEGYGRRLRFLVFDEHNGKLMGLFGLGDPVYAIRDRDLWIGWDANAKAERLYHVMDAYVLGAVQPYSRLLAGKLAALAIATDEVREAFAVRYGNRRALISGKKRRPHLALITTTSALGRSSIYNRVKYRKRFVLEAVGFTNGWGEFHFANGVYKDLSAFACKHCAPTAKKGVWGVGFRNRRELVRKSLSKLGFSQEMLNHGIKRELFVAPLARNARSFLRGKVRTPRYFSLSFDKAARFWRERWLLPRAERDLSYRDFDREQWRLWKEESRARR
jgi:hypothetical protein